MNTDLILKTGKNALKVLTKHRSEILAGVGVLSIVSTAILTAKAVPKVQKTKQICDEMEEDAEKNAESAEELKQELREIRKIRFIRYARDLWKPVCSGTAGCVAIVLSVRSYRKTISGVTGAYILATQEIKDLKDAARELKIVNKNQEHKIREKVAEKKVDRALKKNKPVVFVGNGEDLFIDDWSQQIFKSDMKTVNEACIKLNYQMLNEDTVTMNDFYYLLGIPQAPCGDLVFDSIDGPLELDPDTVLKDDKAYIVCKFNRMPKAM